MYLVMYCTIVFRRIAKTVAAIPSWNDADAIDSLLVRDRELRLCARAKLIYC